MAPYRFVRHWRSKLGRDLAAFDPSKLMTAPILFVAFMAVLDRAVYEGGKAIGMDMPLRITRLSAVAPDSMPPATRVSAANPSLRG